MRYSLFRFILIINDFQYKNQHSNLMLIKTPKVYLKIE